MENLETIQFLMETVERLTKEGTTYKVELEHTKERVTVLEEESARKDVRIAELETKLRELENVMASMGTTVNIGQNYGVVGDDVSARDVKCEAKKKSCKRKGGKDAVDGAGE